MVSKSRVCSLLMAPGFIIDLLRIKEHRIFYLEKIFVIGNSTWKNLFLQIIKHDKDQDFGRKFLFCCHRLIEEK